MIIAYVTTNITMIATYKDKINKDVISNITLRKFQCSI